MDTNLHKAKRAGTRGGGGGGGKHDRLGDSLPFVGGFQKRQKGGILRGKWMHTPRKKREEKWKMYDRVGDSLAFGFDELGWTKWRQTASENKFKLQCVAMCCSVLHLQTYRLQVRRFNLYSAFILSTTIAVCR